MTDLSFSGVAAPATCTPATNRLGSQVFSTILLGQLNPPLDTAITAGTENVFFQFLDLDDLTGTTAASFNIGLIGGSVDPAKGTWPAAGNPIDWWFLADPSGLSPGTGLPADTLSGSIAANKITAGGQTQSVVLPVVIGGVAAPFEMTSVHLAATINATPAPDAPAPPPTLLASSVKVFQTITGNGTGQGLCGNVTVQSLSEIPLPSELTSGATACQACAGSHAYTYCGDGNPVTAGCSSLLDAIVGGCKVLGSCAITALTANQPDVPAVLGGTVHTLTLNASNKVVLPVTPDLDAYSAFLQFTANRAHFTGETCTATSQCITGTTCQGGVCK